MVIFPGQCSLYSGAERCPGRSFASTQGPGQPFSGVGRGSWENGVLDYRTLPLPDAYVFRDAQLGASWTLDYGRQEMVSFDDAEVGRWKGAYIRHKGLGGSMFWELSGDKGAPHEGMEGGLEKEERPGENLVRVVKDAMGGLNLSSQNWLQYEGSKFPNMREGM
jgi:chitinase